MLGPIHFYTLCLTFVLLLNDRVRCAVNASVFYPEKLDDAYGNSADANSAIVYGGLPWDGGNRSAIECTACIGDGAVRPFLDTAQGFAHVVIPGGYKYKWIKRAKDGDLGGNDYEEAIKDNMGLVVCVGIGLVFFLVFPIVGLCVCCCRCCCGKCGGSRKTDGTVRESCHRSGFMVSLSLLSVLVGVGGVLALVSNGYVSDGIDSVHKDVPANLDSLLDFFKESVETLDDITNNDFKFTKQVIFRDLNNIGYILGGEVKASLEKEINLDTVTGTVDGLETAVTNLLTLLPQINENINYVANDVDAYVKAMTDVEENYISSGGVSATTPGLNQTIDKNQIPALSGITELEEVKNESVSDLLSEEMKEMDTIPEKVHNSSTTAVQDIKNSINDYTADVTNITQDLDIEDEIDRQSLKDDVFEYSEKAVKYDEYRWYAGLGLSCIILLIAVLLGLGILLGCCGGNGSMAPHERGCGSNCGGNLLLAACGLTFIFGTLLMLFTTLLFAVGTTAEDYACVALKDPSILDKLIDEYGFLGKTKGDGNYFGDKILDDPNKNLTLSEILNNCENNQGIYKALRINESDRINLTDVLEYKSKFSVEKHMSSINVDFSDIKLLSPNIVSVLEKFNNSIQYNISKYENELNQDVTKSAVDFQADLRTKLLTATAAEKVIYDKTIDEIQAVLDKEGAQLKTSSADLKNKIANLDGLLHPSGQPSVSEEITSLETRLADIDSNIETYGGKSLNDSIKAYTDRLYSVTDRFIDYLLDALDNEIGKCQPVWNFYKSLLKDNFCGTLVDSINGFWFGLGWSLFFLMPSLIIAFKLSSHFRTMELMDDDMKFIPDARQTPPPNMKSNKVGPSETLLLKERDYW